MKMNSFEHNPVSTRWHAFKIHAFAYVMIFGLLAMALPLRASTVVIYDDADLFTNADDVVVSLDNRLLVSNVYTSYLTFDLSGIDQESIESATLSLYLAYYSSNAQSPVQVTITLMDADAAAAMNESGTSPAVGSVYDPDLVSSYTVTITVDGSDASQYWVWDVADLIAANGGSTIVGFSVTVSTTNTFRFTDRDPSNDNGAAASGLPPILTITTTVPEPAGAATLMGAFVLVGLLLRRILRKRA